VNDIKKIERNESPEIIRMREKRLARRDWYIYNCRQKKDNRINTHEAEAHKREVISSILHKEKQHESNEPKRPGVSKFAAAFSFVRVNIDDRGCSNANNWKCKSFNAHKQYIEFLHDFIYPYHIPEPLVFTAIQNEYTKDDQGKPCKVLDYDIIMLAKIWLCDIVSGESFYKNNKHDFTKSEAHYFLTSKMIYSEALSVIELYFYAKCTARNLDDSLCKIISKTFAMKFTNCFNHGIVTGFLDLLARHRDYNVSANELGDICDFVHSKIEDDNTALFSFSGRTMSSIIALANEWHADQLREIAVTNMLQITKDKNKMYNQSWQGIPVNDYIFETDDFVWRIIQLRSAKLLLAEGRAMKNCVASYIGRCSSGTSGIFTVVCKEKATQVTEKRATLEVLSGNKLVQAKAKCNKSLDGKTKKLVTRWAISRGVKLECSI
jgi:hypothetical protein